MKKKLYYLEDLPLFLKSFNLISYHGKGKGGGEVVFEKIIKLYQKRGNTSINTISSKTNILNRFNIIFKLNRGATLFLTAGLRDIDLLFFSIIFKKNIYVYLQVPYHKSISFKKDSIHFLLVKLYLFIINKKAKLIFCNSTQTLGSNNKKTRIILPIFSSDIIKEKIKLYKLNKPQIIFGTAFRLNKERGIGSKDIEGLIVFLKKVKEIVEAKGIKFKVFHFGEFNQSISKDIQKQFNEIAFLGYKKKWIDVEVDAFVFFSNYEGFGLAPLEASSKTPVFVNYAFPKDLLICSPNIYPINDIFEIL
jgi:hypothetical protein